MSASQRKRLEHLWRLGPIDEALVQQLASAYIHEGRPRRAQACLLQALDAGVSQRVIARLSTDLALDRWQGREGQRPKRTWFGHLRGEGLKSAWAFYSKHPDDRFGLPPCVRPDRVILVAQSAVVGMRFVRLVALDARTGRVVWEQVRRDVLKPTAPVWLGGDHDIESLGWAYTQELDDGYSLCVEVFDPMSGESLRLARHPLPRALVTETASSLVAIGPDRLGWRVRWTEEDARFEELILIDRARGGFLDESLPSIPAESLVRAGARLFGIDETGLICLEGARVTTLDAFPAPRHGEVIEGERMIYDAFSTDAALFFYRPEYLPQPPSGRVLVRRQHPMQMDLEENTLRPIELAPGSKLRFLCAPPTGAPFALLIEQRRQRAQLVRVVDGRPHPIAALSLQSHRRDIDACFAGDAVLIRAFTSDGSHHGTLLSIDAWTGQPRWSHELTRSWHQGPIPTATGVIGVHQRGVDCLECR